MLPVENRLPALLCAVCVGAVLAASAARAERADRSKPVNLEADTVTLDDSTKVSVYEGNVVLTQGTLALRAARVTVRQKDGGLDRVEAVGNPVAFRQKTDAGELIQGNANRIDYADATGILELSGQARLKRGDDELRGESIRYDAGSSTYRVTGKPEDAGSSSRVRAVIRPRSTP